MGGLYRIGRLFKGWHVNRASINDTSPGFTIVEVMIVLAVTGALFVATAILINGKQNQAGFNEAVQQIQSQIQQVMNDVATGYFPNSSGFQCTASGGAITISGLTSNAQGTNAGCVFAGKVVQFQVLNTNPEQFAVYTVAASQKDSSGAEAQTLTSPVVVAPGSASPAGFPNLTTTTILQNGLATSPGPSDGHPMMWYNNGGADVAVGAVAFVPTFAPGYSNGNLTSGSQQLDVVPVANTSLGLSKLTAVDAINSNLATSYISTINPSNGVSVCFASGGTNESGLLVIGGSGHPLSVTMTIEDGTTSCGK